MVEAAVGANDAFATLSVNQFQELRESGKKILDATTMQAAKDAIQKVYQLHAKRLAGEIGSIETMTKVREIVGAVDIKASPETPGKG